MGTDLISCCSTSDLVFCWWPGKAVADSISPWGTLATWESRPSLSCCSHLGSLWASITCCFSGWIVVGSSVRSRRVRTWTRYTDMECRTWSSELTTVPNTHPQMIKQIEEGIKTMMKRLKIYEEIAKELSSSRTYINKNHNWRALDRYWLDRMQEWIIMNCMVSRFGMNLQNLVQLKM